MEVKSKFPMQLFTGFKLTLLTRPVLLKVYNEMKRIREAKAKELIDIGSLHKAVEKMHQEVAKKINCVAFEHRNCTAQNIVLHSKFMVGKDLWLS